MSDKTDTQNQKRINKEMRDFWNNLKREEISHDCEKDCGGKPIVINHPSEYESKLRSARVIANFNERMAIIIVGLDREARKVDGRVHLGSGPIVDMIKNYLEEWWNEGTNGPTDKEKIELVKLMLDHRKEKGR